MLERIKWIFLRRALLQRSKPGLNLHWNCYVDRQSNLEGYNSLGPKVDLNRSWLGRFTYVAGGTKITNAKIGSFCSIGQEAIIGGLAKHPLDKFSTHPAFYSTKKQANFSFVKSDLFEEQAKVCIGHDVWVGARSLILDGCSIGTGAVVGAGAVVSKDVPPYAIVGGVPAKIIRFRVNDETKSRLIHDEWWNLPINQLTEYLASQKPHEKK